MISPFKKEYESVTKKRHGVRARLFAHSVHIELNEINAHEYRIAYMLVQDKQRQRGLATECLSWLCELADAYEVKLRLAPCGDPDQEAMSTVRLTAWYQTFGFVRIGMQDEMERLPHAT